MKTLIIGLALAILIASPTLTQSANEAPRSKNCDGSQPGYDSAGRYPSYPPTWCYWW